LHGLRSVRRVISTGSWSSILIHLGLEVLSWLEIRAWLEIGVWYESSSFLE
jgi:hypothetical protein